MRQLRQKASARLTVDMSLEEHKYLKMASANLGVSMREFMLAAAFEKMEDLEDEWLAKKAQETLKRIEIGEEKLIPFKRAKKRVLK
jgi:predicted DNA-binding protein